MRSKKAYYFEYPDIPETFITPHHLRGSSTDVRDYGCVRGHSCSNAIPNHCCATVSFNISFVFFSLSSQLPLLRKIGNLRISLLRKKGGLFPKVLSYSLTLTMLRTKTFETGSAYFQVRYIIGMLAFNISETKASYSFSKRFVAFRN
jgi:hypothetical protein